MIPSLRLSLTVAVATLLAGPALAQDALPSVNWRIATMGSPRAATTHIETIKKFVEEKTDSRFSITIGYGTFGDSREFLDLIKIGAIQGATVQASVSAERLPLYTVLDLPFLPISGAEEQRAVHDAVHLNKAILREFAGWGAFPFMSSLLPTYELMGKGNPPQKLADISGMRMRALGGNGDALSKFGAVTSNMPPQEMYVAMDRGLISAVALPYYAHVSYRTYELGDWMTTNMGMSGTALPVVLSIEAWDALPQQYRDVLMEAREAAYAAQIAAMEHDTAAALDKIKASGMTLIEISDEDMAELRRVGARPIWEEWVAKNSAAHPEAQALLDFVLGAADAPAAR
ncbi:TRAP transporter substrate-binding protein DctP [Propylenella binzhouense]|nr:TRAP transporter substrate-binding protein DctP [Propylenella binzhouense]